MHIRCRTNNLNVPNTITVLPTFIHNAQSGARRLVGEGSYDKTNKIYLKDSGYRLIDLFRDFAKDRNQLISWSEFYTGC